MQPLEHFLRELQEALHQGIEKATIEEWGRSPLLQEHELVQASYALLAQQKGMPVGPLHFSPTSSGALPLFRRGFLPWRSLPYPKEHAQLGACLAQLGEKQTVLQMARFQEATLDHDKKPIYSLFLQEGFPCRRELEEANTAFFESIGQAPSEEVHYADAELGMVARRTATSTLVCVGSGCKSGLGAFLYQDAGIINWGPQLSAVGTCAGFGLAGRAQKVHLEQAVDRFSLGFTCRLAAPSTRATGFSHIQDAGYSGHWLEAEMSGDNEELSCTARLHAVPATHQSMLFTFFGKGRACSVAGTHKLSPKSLDRYQGPSQPIRFEGACGGVQVEVLEGSGRMEIIPLAGDESFWGADFLVAYTLQGPQARFTLQKID